MLFEVLKLLDISKVSHIWQFMCSLQVITIFKIISDGQIYQAILTIEIPDHFFMAFQPKGIPSFLILLRRVEELTCRT
jgi:hypothetical protein